MLSFSKRVFSKSTVQYFVNVTGENKTNFYPRSEVANYCDTKNSINFLHMNIFILKIKGNLPTRIRSHFKRRV